MEHLKINIIDYFKDLKFNEEKHLYTVDNKDLTYSVSGLIKKYKYPTDWKEVLRRTAQKYDKSEQEISESWEFEANKGCAIGNKAHLFGEDYALNRTLIPETGYDKAIVKFWNDLPEFIVPLLLEVRMYHKEFLFAGTADILLLNTLTDKIIICDYKTNKNLFKNFASQKMVYPFNQLLCNPFNHYQIQLSYYQILLEQVTGVKVFGRKLIWLKDDGNYLLYDLADYTKELKDDLYNKNICLQ